MWEFSNQRTTKEEEGPYLRKLPRRANGDVSLRPNVWRTKMEDRKWWRTGTEHMRKASEKNKKRDVTRQKKSMGVLPKEKQKKKAKKGELGGTKSVPPLFAGPN